MLPTREKGSCWHALWEGRVAGLHPRCGWKTSVSSTVHQQAVPGACRIMSHHPASSHNHRPIACCTSASGHPFYHHSMLPCIVLRPYGRVGRQLTADHLSTTQDCISCLTGLGDIRLPPVGASATTWYEAKEVSHVCVRIARFRRQGGSILLGC